MALQESGEMYLETILVLSQKLPHVRAIDICEYMNYSKPSVSRAVSLLKGGGYITVDGDSHIHLTDTGMEIAQKINERHCLLTAYLVSIGVSEATASEDACRMEHYISDESFEAMKRHLKAEHGIDLAEN